ncbi:MAG: GNAT family N-acetyltransferase [Anaerolineales bacterium]
MSLQLIPASQFTVEALTQIYNQTRVDYLVPMPMNAARLAEYIHDYDIDLERSVVAAREGKPVGVGMLGIRQNRSWITRLGVLPVKRRAGIGESIMVNMLEHSDQPGIELCILEVIEGNTPAHNLFLKLGFRETRTYLVLRRAPRLMEFWLRGRISWLDKEDSLVRLREASLCQSWINAAESMENADNLQGIRLVLPDGSSGWLVYRYYKFTLSHLILHTESGDPVKIGMNLLAHLHCQHRMLDTYAENIEVNDPHLPALKEMGYFEAFRRIEMHRR